MHYRVTFYSTYCDIKMTVTMHSQDQDMPIKDKSDALERARSQVLTYATNGDSGAFYGLSANDRSLHGALVEVYVKDKGTWESA